MIYSLKSNLKKEMYDFLTLRKSTMSKSCYDHDYQTLKDFDNYLYNAKCFDKITENLILGWIENLKGKSSTIANKVIIIKKFLEFIRGYDIEVFLPEIPRIHDDYEPYIFSDGEIEQLFHYADRLEKFVRARKNHLLHIEMPMILRLMYGCGLRIGETLLLQMKDVDTDAGILTMRKTKGNKHRFVPMHPSLNVILRDYCLALAIVSTPDAFLFPVTEKSSEAVSPQNAGHKFDYIIENKIAINYKRKKHERGPCLHCLRHIFVFKSFKQSESMDVRIDDMVPFLSLYLGHNSLKETEKYLKFSSHLYPEAMELFENFVQDTFPEVTYEK